MMNSLGSVETWDGWTTCDYHGLLANAGYESRATNVSLRLGGRAKVRTACAFTDRALLSFEENVRWFNAQDFEVEYVNEGEVREWTGLWVKRVIEHAEGSESVFICVDISSMSRLRLAAVVEAMMECDARLTVDFVYSLAKWNSVRPSYDPIVSSGAVSPYFGGWTNDSDQPSIAIIGLGYEPNKAVGAYEYLEAASVWTFVPESEDDRYTRDVLKANRSLLKRIPASRQFKYEVSQPLSCFGLLESVAFGLVESARPVLVPFGPKIFALNTMLVACIHRSVAVWRISSEQLGEAADRRASGTIVGVRAHFSATNSVETATSAATSPVENEFGVV